MNKPAPRLATWLLIRFSSGPQGEAIAGDLMEQYVAHPSRWWYWRQVLSAMRADIFTTARDHKWRTAAAIAMGWVAYFATAFPATWLIRRSRLITQWWLSDIDPQWFLLTLRVQSSFIIGMVCLAIGWGVAKASRRSAPGAVCLLAMTVLIFEYGMIALLLSTQPMPAGSISTVDLITTALFTVSRPAGILLGGLFGMRPQSSRLAA